MMLIRLSGHSGAGKTRLVNALVQCGITCPKVTRYTSRAPRPEEKEGEDYFFRSRDYISSLPGERYLVGPVRNMLQAFDLHQIVSDLKAHDLVLIEIYPGLWPELLEKLHRRSLNCLSTASVFMTAVDPGIIRDLPDDETRSEYISGEVRQNLLWRSKDRLDDIEIRARSAAQEILEALSESGQKEYDRIIFSAPEGPDGEDEWTKSGFPSGKAKEALEEFIRLYQRLRT
jgi:hypothetical protein